MYLKGLTECRGSSAAAWGPSVCLSPHHSPPSSYHSSHLTSHRAEHDLDRCSHRVSPPVTHAVKRPVESFHGNCAAALAQGVKTARVVLQPLPVAWFHSPKPSGMLTPWSPMGCLFVVCFGLVFTKLVYTQSSSVSLVKFMHGSKTLPLEQGCPT